MVDSLHGKRLLSLDYDFDDRGPQEVSLPLTRGEGDAWSEFQIDCA